MDAGSGKKLCQLSRGDSFGEVNVNRALENDGGRYMWVTREETELMELDMDKYRRFLMNHHEREIEERVIFLRSLVVPLFCDYQDPLLYELAKALTKRICPHQMPIIRQGEAGNRMYFIRRGEVTVLKHIEVTEANKGASVPADQPVTTVKYIRVAYLKPREYFGELSLLNNDPRATSIYCSSNVELLVMSKIDFTRFVSKAAIDKMREYAQGYPKEQEIRKVYMKQRKWETYKKQVMEEGLLCFHLCFLRCRCLR
jgi:CRP-like cAMP-binding protein